MTSPAHAGPVPHLTAHVVAAPRGAILLSVSSVTDGDHRGGTLRLPLAAADELPEVIRAALERFRNAA